MHATCNNMQKRGSWLDAAGARHTCHVLRMGMLMNQQVIQHLCIQSRFISALEWAAENGGWPGMGSKLPVDSRLACTERLVAGEPSSFPRDTPQIRRRQHSMTR